MAALVDNGGTIRSRRGQQLFALRPIQHLAIGGYVFRVLL